MPLEARDPAPQHISTRRDLARALTQLREAAHVTIRELARTSGVPPATVGGYCSGRHVPVLTNLAPFVAVLHALGVADTSPWTAAVERLWWASSLRTIDSRSPYKGLEGYDEHDAEWFFGRKRLTAEVLARIAERRGHGGAIALVGASGSGKSSLLRAGVIAEVAAGALGDGWGSAIITPGREPLARLHRALAALPEDRPGVVIVDQVEELFTEKIEPRELDAFVHRLGDLGADRVVILGMRADFYAAATRVSLLVPLLQSSQVVVGPLSEDSLRAVITEPARIAGVELSDELVTRVLADLAPADRISRAHDIGRLPLLSHALRATWEAALPATPTVTHYEAIGGIGGAIARTADDVYASLEPAAQQLAQRMFLRLLNNDGELLTRRNVLWSELIDPDQEDPLASEVIEAFISARLLTADAETVRVAHEALLTSWPRIDEWLEAGRARLHLRRQISDAAAQWDDANRDPSMLWRGGRLDSAESFAASTAAGELNRREREFIDAAVAERAAEAAAVRRRSRFRSRLFGVVAALAVVSIVLAGVAVAGQRSAQQARDEALSRQIAINANLLTDSDPALAQQLALAGYQVADTVEARSALLDVASAAAVTRFAVPTGPASVATSADGTLIATGNVDGALRLFKHEGSAVTLLSVLEIDPTNHMYGVALSPDGRWAAIGGTGSVVRLVDASDPERPVLLEQELAASGIEALTFSPDGTLLVGSSKFATAHRWAIAADGTATVLGALQGFGGPLHQATVSPDSSTIATASNDGVVRLWDARLPGETATPLASLDFGAVSNHVLGVSFHPDGTVLAVGTRDGHVRLLDVGADSLTLQDAVFGSFTAAVNAVAFGANGTEVAAGSSDRTVRVFDVATGAEIDRMPNTTPITSLAYAGQTRQLVVGAPDGYVRLWRRGALAPPTTELGIGSIAMTTDGTFAAVSQRSATAGSVTFWDLADPYAPRRVLPDATSQDFLLNGTIDLAFDGALLAAGTTTGEVLLYEIDESAVVEVGRLSAASVTVQDLSFHQTSDVLVVATDDAAVSLWNLNDPRAPVHVSTQKHARDRLLGVTFDPRGALVAAASADASVYLYRVAQTGLELVAEIADPENFVHAVAFSPDGALLAVGSADQRVRLYDMRDYRHPVMLGEPLRGPTGYVYDLAFSASGQHLAAAADGVVWAWQLADAERPQLTGALRASAGSITAVAISPIDDAIVAGGSQARLLRWDPHPERVAAAICEVVGSAVTDDEWAQYVAGAAYHPPCG